MFNGVTAIVVSYFPDNNIIRSLINSLINQVDHIILVDNGGGKNTYDYLLWKSRKGKTP